jgi:excisionase family DNA binding protein
MSAAADRVEHLAWRPDMPITKGRPDATADDVLTVKEVATFLQLSPRTGAEYGARGVLPSVKIGRHRRFSRRQLEALMGGRHS